MSRAIKKTDSEIHQDVLRELKWDTRVDETDVGVEVDRGVVTLTGTVSSWAKRAAAQESAHRVAGVLDVANDLTVRLPGSAGLSDTELAHAVRHALEWDVFVPHEQIRSTVSGGAVTLEGEVQHWNQRADAERAIHNLRGVRLLTNHIDVRPPRVSLAAVRQAIEDVLERHVAREAERIELDVQDGRVTLSGVVRSWAEREAAVGAVRGTPGVRKVEDHLRIEVYTPPS
jgi:osmotically-inducible protein OsmY